MLCICNSFHLSVDVPKSKPVVPSPPSTDGIASDPNFALSVIVSLASVSPRVVFPATDKSFEKVAFLAVKLPPVNVPLGGGLTLKPAITSRSPYTFI